MMFETCNWTVDLPIIFTSCGCGAFRITANQLKGRQRTHYFVYKSPLNVLQLIHHRVGSLRMSRDCRVLRRTCCFDESRGLAMQDRGTECLD